MCLSYSSSKNDALISESERCDVQMWSRKECVFIDCMDYLFIKTFPLFLFSNLSKSIALAPPVLLVVKFSFIRPCSWVEQGNGEFTDGSPVVGAAIHGNLACVPRKRHAKPGKLGARLIGYPLFTVAVLGGCYECTEALFNMHV